MRIHVRVIPILTHGSGCTHDHLGTFLLGVALVVLPGLLEDSLLSPFVGLHKSKCVIQASVLNDHMEI